MALKSSIIDTVKFEGGSIVYIESDGVGWDETEASLLHVSVPAGELRSAMEALGFHLKDRTVYVSVPVIGDVDYSKGVRIMPTHAEEADEACFRIAQEGFTNDSRFHVNDNEALANSILRSWLGGCCELMVCKVHGETAGFLDLSRIGNDAFFVRLAATELRFRLAGTALSLYSRAAQMAQESGMRSLEGRISTRNMAVMNLYSHLGGKFSDPRDVYIKDVRHEAR